ncbi:MAG: sugar transferase, partial [Lachnospiraceae bacterium]|nr:sugar transferase [Lachnospiraceae bacterium]
MYRKFFKRILDIIISFSAIVILSPVLLVLAILVRVKLGSPVIFRQQRPGLNGKIFGLM